MTWGVSGATGDRRKADAVQNVNGPGLIAGPAVESN